MTENNNPNHVEHAILSEHSSGWAMDNALCVAALHSGVEPPIDEVLDLAAEAKSLFVLVNLYSRSLTRTHECRGLWMEVEACYQQAVNAWESLHTHSPLLDAYRRQLDRLLELSSDRVEMYVITAKERQVFAAQKGGSPPKADTPIREFNTEEMACVDRALDRRLQRS